MLPIIAQVDASQLGDWMKIAAWVTGIILAVLLAIRQLKPHPPEWQEGDEALRREFREETEQLHGRLSKLRDEMTVALDRTAASVHGANAETQRQLAGVHERINQILAAVARLEGRMERERDRV